MQRHPCKMSFLEPPTPPITPKTDPKILSILYQKRRNASTEKPPDDANIQERAEPETCEVVTKFLTSQGLPLEAIQDTMFQNLFYYLNPKKIIPTPEILKKYMERMGNPKKYSQALSKATGPLSVTIDVIEKENGDNYLTFSIHFFEGFEERKCLINLKKLSILGIEAESILTVIRRAISMLNHHQVEIAYFVVPNERMFHMFKPYNDVIKHQFISFHHLLGSFVESILKIKVFSKGIQQLRAFVTLIKAKPDFYLKLRKMSLISHETYLNLPNMDDKDSWISTATFLKECLAFNPKFEHFAARCKASYISNNTFSKLSCLNKFLQECLKHAKDLSGELSSISQVIPSIMSMRNYITENLSNRYKFEADIRKAFSNTFQELTGGQMSRRYDIATLLDPRFAYDESIYPNGTWSDIEKAVIEEVLIDTEKETREDIIQKVQGELDAYQTMCIESRPKTNESPFQWWNSQKDNLENLVLIAREYLACPAVSIDAQQFFGSGGKFSNLVEIYDSKRLESYLNCAGHHQQFLGHGSNIEHITGDEISKLNEAVHRKRLIAAPEGMVFPKAMNIRDKILMRDQNSSVQSSEQTLEIDSKDLKLEDVDYENTVDHKQPGGSKDPIVSIQKKSKPPDAYARIEKEHNYYKATEVSLKKWALGQPMTVLKAVKPPELNQIEPSNDNDEAMELKPDIEHTVEDSREIKLEDEDYVEEEPIQTTSTTWAQDSYTLEDVKLEFEEKDPVEIKLEQLDYPYKLTENDHDNQKTTRNEPEDIKPKEEQFDDNYEPLEMKPDIEELNNNQKPIEERIEPWYPIHKPMPTGLLNSSDNSPRRYRLSSMRKCSLCEAMRPVLCVKNVTNDNERLFILLGAIIENRLDTLSASVKYFDHYYYCTTHFQKSCLAILTKLDVRSPDGIMNCDEAKFGEIFKLINLIRRLPTSFEQAKMMLAAFTDCYQFPPKYKARFTQRKSSKFDVKNISITTESLIIPKEEERVPRKQKFEEEPEATIRIIEIVPFKLPDNSDETTEEAGKASPNYQYWEYTSDSAPSRPRGRPRKYPKIEKEEDSEDEQICRFCSEFVNKTEAFKGAKNWIRLSEWNKYLGVDFVRNLDYRDDNYVCKKHFRMISCEQSSSLDLPIG